MPSAYSPASRAERSDPFVLALADVDTPTLCNAIDQLGLREPTSGYASTAIKRLSSERGPMVGYAVTVAVDTTTPGQRPASTGLYSVFEALAVAPVPSVIVFSEVGARPAFGCHCGEVIATIAKRLGCVGIVSDVGVRDAVEIAGLGLHCFAAGYVAARGNYQVLEVGGTVTVAGLSVRNGDLLHGDVNGLTIVPPELSPHLADAIESVQAKERRILESVSAPSFSVEQLSAVYGSSDQHR